MRKVHRVVASVAVAVAATVIGSPALANPSADVRALAAPAARIAVYESWIAGNCPTGYVCAHADAQMQYSGVGFYYDDPNWNVGDLAYGNVARSAINKGVPGSYDDVIFYPCTKYQTCAGIPSYRLNNQQHVDWFPNDLKPESHKWVN
ncbi:MAG: hypothetical protein QG622_2910 [Actinomycetota bacterium]|nr:hypothetical protein [Actinomycetota bacterium]